MNTAFDTITVVGPDYKAVGDVKLTLILLE